MNGKPLSLSNPTPVEGNRFSGHEQKKTDGFWEISVPGLYDMTTEACSLLCQLLCCFTHDTMTAALTLPAPDHRLDAANMAALTDLSDSFA